jgi:hypothetical protein
MPGQDNIPRGIPPEFLKGLQERFSEDQKHIQEYPRTPEEVFELKQSKAELNECVKNDRLSELAENVKLTPGVAKLFEPQHQAFRMEPIGQEELITEMTALMREADQVFEKVGGSTRHYVRDVLLPLMEAKGLCFCRIIK